MSTAELTVNYSPVYSVTAYLKSLLGSIFAIIVFFLTMIVVIPAIILSLGLLKNVLIKHFGAFIGRIILLALGIKLTYDESHYKPDKPAVFITNHSSTLDLFTIISMKLPNVRYVAKKELQYNPLFFVIGRITGQIFIDRKRSKETILKLQKLYDRVKRRNLSLLIAPEGSRKHREIVGQFKKGAFHIARDLGYDIVPVYIDGAYHLCPGSSLVTQSGEVKVRYFPPVSFDNLTDEEMNEKIEELRSFYKEQYRLTFEREGIPIEA